MTRMKSCLVVIMICTAVTGRAHARYYDAAQGRFISPDSTVPNAVDPQSLNRYAYVRNNPVNLADPTGNSWLSHESGAHWNVNRVIHHNLGINSVDAGFFAGYGGEVKIYFSDTDAKVGGGVGVGAGAEVDVNTGDGDIFVGHGAAATVGYDPYYGSYASAWGGCTLCGGASGSATYYFNSHAYQAGAGYGIGNFGVNVGYSNVGGTSVGGGYGGLGANYGLKNHETRYTVSMNDQDLSSAYKKGKQSRKFDGYSAGPIVDFIGTVTAGWIAADNHDGAYRTPGESKAEADFELMTDMAKGSMHDIGQPGGLTRAAVGLMISPLYYGAVTIGGGPAYRADQLSHLRR